MISTPTTQKKSKAKRGGKTTTARRAVDTRLESTPSRNTLEIQQLLQTIGELQFELQARTADAASLMEAYEYELTGRRAAEAAFEAKAEDLRIYKLRSEVLEEENLLLKEEIQAYQQRPVHARKLTRSRRSLVTAGFDFALDDATDDKNSFERRSSIVQRILNDDDRASYSSQRLSDRLSWLTSYYSESKDTLSLLTTLPPNTNTTTTTTTTSDTNQNNENLLHHPQQHLQQDHRDISSSTTIATGPRMKSSTKKKKKSLALGDWNASSVARFFPF